MSGKKSIAVLLAAACSSWMLSIPCFKWRKTPNFKQNTYTRPYFICIFKLLNRIPTNKIPPYLRIRITTYQAWMCAVAKLMQNTYSKGRSCTAIFKGLLHWRNKHQTYLRCSLHMTKTWFSFYGQTLGRPTHVTDACRYAYRLSPDVFVICICQN
jgi:hypothetical protein